MSHCYTKCVELPCQLEGSTPCVVERCTIHHHPTTHLWVDLDFCDITDFCILRSAAFSRAALVLHTLVRPLQSAAHSNQLRDPFLQEEKSEQVSRVSCREQVHHICQKVLEHIFLVWSICKKAKEMFFLVSGAFVYHVKATINHRATWDPKIWWSSV